MFAPSQFFSLQIHQLITTLMVFFACYATWQKMSKGPEKANSLACLWHTSMSLTVDQLYKPEEMSKTIATRSDTLSLTFFFVCFLLPEVQFVVDHIICCPLPHQNLSHETWMSPELAQCGSAAGRKLSHWGTQVEHTATIPISILCRTKARWIAELWVSFSLLCLLLHLWTQDDFWILLFFLFFLDLVPQLFQLLGNITAVSL